LTLTSFIRNVHNRYLQFPSNVIITKM